MSLVDLVLVVITVVAAITDARCGRIPNCITLPPLMIAPLAHGVFGGATSAAASAAGALVSMAIPWTLYRVSRGEAIGGGDLKLFGAIGAIGGPITGIEIELASFLLLAVYALVVLAYRGRLLAVSTNTLRLAAQLLFRRRTPREVMPEALTTVRMGPCIALAAVATICSAHLPKWVL